MMPRYELRTTEGKIPEEADTATYALVYDNEGRYVAAVHALTADPSPATLNQRAALYAAAPDMRALLRLAQDRLSTGSEVDRACASGIGKMLAKTEPSEPPRKMARRWLKFDADKIGAVWPGRDGHLIVQIFAFENPTADDLREPGIWAFFPVAT